MPGSRAAQKVQLWLRQGPPHWSSVHRATSKAAGHMVSCICTFWGGGKSRDPNSRNVALLTALSEKVHPFLSTLLFLPQRSDGFSLVFGEVFGHQGHYMKGIIAGI